MQVPDQQIISDLQSNPASIIDKDEAGQTPLHLAVINKNYELMDFILNHPLVGEVINAQDVIGQTPLHEAVVADDVRAVTKILSKKPNIELKNHYNETAYDIAVDKKHIFIEQQILLYQSLNPQPAYEQQECEQTKPLEKHKFPPYIQEKIDEYIKKTVPPNPAILKAKNKISKKSKTKNSQKKQSNEHSSQEME